MCMDERVSEESKQMGETIRESVNECEKVMSKMKRGVDWGRGEKRKVKGGQKIKGRKRSPGMSGKMVGGQKRWLIRTGEPLRSRGRNCFEGQPEKYK